MPDERRLRNRSHLHPQVAHHYSIQNERPLPKWVDPNSAASNVLVQLSKKSKCPKRNLSSIYGYRSPALEDPSFLRTSVWRPSFRALVSLGCNEASGRSCCGDDEAFPKEEAISAGRVPAESVDPGRVPAESVDSAGGGVGGRASTDSAGGGVGGRASLLVPLADLEAFLSSAFFGSI